MVMRLTSFSYKTSGWELTEMSPLDTTNLLVGKNASGKTRIIMALQNVTNFMQMKPAVFVDKEFKVKMTFDDVLNEGWKMTYSFDITKDCVVSESLTVNGKSLIRRSADKAIFYKDSVNPPLDKLLVQIRRDKTAYPQVEALMEWVEGVISVSCSNINNFTLILGGTSLFVNPLPFSTLVDALGKEGKKYVLENARALGYDILDIYTVKASGEMTFVMIRERYSKQVIADFQLSNGMIRVLYILCFLVYIRHNRKHSLLLIDDLGEGLDYNRATLLGNIVFDSCEKENLQLIASSNDSFMMDVVDIRKWQILRRKNSKLNVLNHINASELFNSFLLTGLSNFDLFASDYIDSYLAHSER